MNTHNNALLGEVARLVELQSRTDGPTNVNEIVEFAQLDPEFVLVPEN
jgi:hypothetical protein